MVIVFHCKKGMFGAGGNTGRTIWAEMAEIALYGYTSNPFFPVEDRVTADTWSIIVLEGILEIESSHTGYTGACWCNGAKRTGDCT